MSYSVTFEPESITDLDLITDFIRLRILNKIKWLAINFEQITPLPLKYLGKINYTYLTPLLPLA
ncbi:MAG: hypothetical protein ACKPAE_11790, partial [Microcystis panniformis]